MKRPELGTRVRASDRLVRKVDYRTGRKDWIRYLDWIRKAVSVEGIYIGCRTYQNGVVHYGGAEEMTYFEPDGYVSVWLIVTHGNLNPIPVLPEDVEVIS